MEWSRPQRKFIHGFNPERLRSSGAEDSSFYAWVEWRGLTISYVDMEIECATSFERDVAWLGIRPVVLTINRS